MLVKNRMTHKVVSVTPDVSLYQVMTLLEDNKFDGLPIVDKGKVIGIVDEKIIMREFCACCAQQNQEAGIDTDMPIPFASTKVAIEPDRRRIAHFLHRRTVSELVLSDEEVVVIDADEPIEHASYLMFRHSVDVLPVLNDKNELVGVLTKYTCSRGRVHRLMKKNDISIDTLISSQSRRVANTVLVTMKVQKGKGPEAKKLLERNGFKLIHQEV